MCVRAGDQREEEEEVFVVTAWLQGIDLEKATQKKKKIFCWTDSSKATVALMIEDQDQDYTKS